MSSPSSEDPATSIEKSAGSEVSALSIGNESPAAGSRVSNQIVSESNSLLEDIHETQNEDFLLLDGIDFIPTAPVARSTVSLRSKSSVMSFRLEALSRPKAYCAKDTLERFQGLLDNKSKANLRKHIDEQDTLRSIIAREHLKNCFQALAPTPQPSRTRFDEAKASQIMKKMETKMKREAYDRLVAKIIQKLPKVILNSDSTDLSKLKPGTQRMINVVFATITQYIGSPLTVHDCQLYVQLCVGITKFIGNVIESVRSGKVPAAVCKKGNGQTTMTSRLLKELSEDIATAQWSREILKCRRNYT
ncbi:uncharacterized protein LOC131430725 [Malaya genurostris]|uniref:uncharacterized protein LOC131430725 n=1 Tax=Malaya genurostris TaxID=325434 RepID=UPI0026F39822|nr:uncharacterized protein LOC131430725 [Malaya genurostris]